MALVECESDDAIEIRVPCKPEYVRTVRHAVADFAESFNMPKSAVEEVEIAASEAVANIVRHAYVGLDTRIPPMRVKCFHKRDKLILEIIDRGCGFEVPRDEVIPEVDFSRDGGLGIILIKCLMDRVNYTSGPSGGTKIRMTKRARDAVSKAARRRCAHLISVG